ncbi:MAG: hypothetical protein KAQ87_01570 [Candidatus Pacebacteria bacterium]|nr:hypothetical protein [Candidatus Paceibacterota bacterium]
MLNVNKVTLKNASEALRVLWAEEFFKSWRNLSSISDELSSRGNNFLSKDLCVALLRAKFLTRRGKRGFFEYAQKKNAVSKEIKNIEHNLFSDDLVKKLGKAFMVEIEDLRLNFGKSGNCTAFLLRKILEKLIYITFAKNNLLEKLENQNSVGKLIGLKSMINKASLEKIKGTPFITPKTAQEINGIKFLGDVSAHNPLVNVDMKTIIPQMPYIITVYKELSQKL